VILDLRDNPGGSLHSAVETVSAFVGGGAVVKMESNEGEIVYAGSSSDPTELPLLVLVNAGSASASEMAAAVLAERGRATVVGERSHGKNTVQRLFPLPNGGAIKLTVGRCSPPRARTWEASASSRSSSSTSLRIWARPPSWRP
jgi:carboxyl-terminal processing protease